MHIVESIRKEDQSVLLLDCGAVFDTVRDKAGLMLKAMERMGYDALNIGSPELQFGNEFLERSRSRVSFPYIASNLLYQGSRLPWIREYIIKEAGGIKVAILGVLNPDDLAQLPNQEQEKGWQVMPPEAALERLLAEVRQKADLVILLSRFGIDKTRELAQTAKGIDVAISSGCDNVFYVKPLEGTILLQRGALGKTMGLLKIALDEKRGLGVTERRYVPLDRSVPDNEEIAELVEEFKKVQATKQAKMKEELMEGLKLTPEEFIKRYQKEQAEQKEGEVK